MRIFVVILMLLAWYFFSWTYIDVRKSQCCASNSQGQFIGADESNTDTQFAIVDNPSSTQENESEEPAISDENNTASTPEESSTPIDNGIGFQPSDATITLSDQFEPWKEELAASVTHATVVEITGLQYADEESTGLARARARAIRDALLDGIPRSSLSISTREVNEMSADQGDFQPFEINVRERPSGITEVDGKSLIYFPWGSVSNTVGRDIEKWIDGIIEQLENNNDIVVLTGHTDHTSSADFNLRLGMRRANAIRAQLVKQGLAPSRIRVQSKGETEPIATNDTEEGREINRRVELEISPR